MFRRKIEKPLADYYRNPDAKIPLIKGPRQIGKSYIIRETGTAFFPHFVEVDLKSDYEGDGLFKDVKTTKAFHIALSSIHGAELGGADDTLVFLDEIQFYPNLITLLKDLKKEKRYRYICSGSLLGITMKHVFIPMGSIDEIPMYPMDFEEFLWANGVGTEAIEHLRSCFRSLSPIEEPIHRRFLSLFKDYLIAGGLPDAVTEYVINRNVAQTRHVQDQTIGFYKDDCSKYDEQHKLKIMRIYDMLVSYMSNKVKRIQFKAIEDKPNSSMEKYQDEIDYLLSSGIALGVRAVANPAFPLTESMSKDLIKLYYDDVGLLTNLLYRNNVMPILSQDRGINLGSAYETAVAMELKAHGHDLYYFDSKKTGEVDFLINDYDHTAVLPIEIKSGRDQENYRAIPRLLDENGSYRLPLGYVFGNKNAMERKGNLITMPIYMVMFL